MDFVMKPISFVENEKSLYVEFVLELDPRRYDTIEIDGKRAYVDKSTRIAIIEEDLLKSLPSMNGIPILYDRPKQLDYHSYLKERKTELAEFWDKKLSLDNFTNPIEHILNKLKDKDTQVVIIYVDLEGSSRLSSEIENDIYIKIIKIFLMQMAKVIDNYKGFVLKAVGDCVIGIFPAEDNFLNTCDNAIQAAMIMRSVVEEVINPVFIEKGLPKIGFHIGLDIGSVRADRFGAPDIAAIDDLIGYPMNLVAKIQSRAGHNDVLLGRRLFELLHNSWQAFCEKVDLGDDWMMRDPIDKDEIYKIYRFHGKFACDHYDEK